MSTAGDMRGKLRLYLGGKGSGRGFWRMAAYIFGRFIEYFT
jgi:hypothetical protein